MKKILNNSAQLLLIIGVVYYWIESASLFNPVAIALMLLLFLELIINNLILTLLSSSIIGLLSIYMMLAVISEYREFPAGDAEGKTLLIVGLSIFISSLLLSAFMSVRRLFFTN